MQEVGADGEDDDNDDDDATSTGTGTSSSNGGGSGCGSGSATHSSKHLVAPLSVQPMRKATTLSMDALRRL